MKHAHIKLNGGIGALLCNNCSVILATGTKHEDREHYCQECEDNIRVAGTQVLLASVARIRKQEEKEGDGL